MIDQNQILGRERSFTTLQTNYENKAELLAKLGIG
jgi:hypothetical protein